MAFIDKRCPECGGGGWVCNASAPYGRSCRTCKKGRDKLREAAPDLYEALKIILEYPYGDASPLDDQLVMERARAAIRKAEGEE